MSSSLAKKTKSFFWGLLLVPFTLATLYHLPLTLPPFYKEPNSLIYLIVGVGTYFLFEILFNKPMRTYVFGHELTHALAALAMGGKVHSFHVSKKRRQRSSEQK